MQSNNKIPTLSNSIQNDNENDLMDEANRTKAKAALNSFIHSLLKSPDKYARLIDAKDPLPKELSNILRLLAEVCKQTTNPDEDDAAVNTKQICTTARFLRQILHGPKACDYRALGLNSEATQEQIHNHYRWLNTLFSFDNSIDPNYQSIRRIMQAYIGLNDSGLQHKYDNTLPPSLASHNNALVVTQKPPSLQHSEHKTNKRKHNGIAIATITLITLAGGLGWAWLLDSVEPKKVENTTVFSEIELPKNKLQQPQQIDPLAAHTQNEFITEKKSDPPADIEEPPQPAITSINLDEETATPNPATIEAELDKNLAANLPTIIVLNPEMQKTTTIKKENIQTAITASKEAESDNNSDENLPIIATLSKETHKTATIEKENIQATTTESKMEPETQPIISLLEQKNVAQPKPPTRDFVSTKDETPTQTDVDVMVKAASLKNNSMQTTSAKQQAERLIPPLSPIPIVTLKMQAARIAAENELNSTAISPASKKNINIEKPIQVATLDESALQLAEKPLAKMMLVIGSPNLEVSSLSKEQVENIFLGKMTTLPNGQKIELFDQQDGNTIKRNFYKVVTGKTPRQIKAHWTKLQFRGQTHRPETLTNDQATKERVATSKFAIGYINGAFLDSSVKVLRSFK